MSRANSDDGHSANSEQASWLEDVFAAVKDEMATWPEWMQKAYREWAKRGR